MFWKGHMQRLKVVLAVRVLVITLIAIAASLPGGLFAFTKAGTVLRDNSRRHAVATTRWLARAAESSVRRQDPEGLELLADHLASDPNTLYVAILNEKGEAIAAAGAKTRQQCWPYLSDVPLGTSSCEILPGNVLSLLEPIRADGQDELLGGVRLVLDTSATATELAGIRRRLVNCRWGHSVSDSTGRRVGLAAEDQAPPMPGGHDASVGERGLLGPCGPIAKR